ncbi:hypothetical protein WMY93_020769 [Mugilogobius chulae]|uniref:Scavenger receptor class B member 1 n=1 Tax=Mugilogobius chulae TaxID=88201 RepID=A0AAW0NIU2_9GOBI
MKTVPGITETGKISEVVMPMLWFEESGYIDGPILKTFHTNLVILPALMEYMQYGFIALGLVTIVISVLVLRKQKKDRGADFNKETPGFARQSEPIKSSHEVEKINLKTKRSNPNAAAAASDGNRSISTEEKTPLLQETD